jgi:hypothetical protein
MNAKISIKETWEDFELDKFEIRSNKYFCWEVLLLGSLDSFFKVLITPFFIKYWYPFRFQFILSNIFLYHVLSLNNLWIKTRN